MLREALYDHTEEEFVAEATVMIQEHTYKQGILLDPSWAKDVVLRIGQLYHCKIQENLQELQDMLAEFQKRRD